MASVVGDDTQTLTQARLAAILYPSLHLGPHTESASFFSHSHSLWTRPPSAPSRNIVIVGPNWPIYLQSIIPIPGSRCRGGKNYFFSTHFRLIEWSYAN